MTRTGRPRAFDIQQALARARDLFWSRGYAATSVQDLVDELEVQRGSLYAAFGDKHGLYLKAVGLYAKENRENLEAALLDGPVLPVLRRILLEPSALTGATEQPGGRRGCLVGNTTAELVPGDEAARALAAAAYDGFIEVVTAAMARAQAAGEVTTSATPEAQARLLLLLFQGSALVSRAQPDRERLAASIDAALDALRASLPLPMSDSAHYTGTPSRGCSAAVRLRPFRASRPPAGRGPVLRLARRLTAAPTGPTALSPVAGGS
jgi:TetR/AcrR family transcriptional repressor of nem operon